MGPQAVNHQQFIEWGRTGLDGDMSGLQSHAELIDS